MMMADIDDLERLARLRRNGTLSEDEFSGLKAKLLARPAASPRAAGLSPPEPEAQTIRPRAEYMKLSGIAWIVVGTLQICMIVTIIAGIWNVAIGVSRLSEAKAITRRDLQAVENVRGTTQLVVVGLVNLFLGAIIGVILIGVDFSVRDQILKNERLFHAQAEDQQA